MRSRHSIPMPVLAFVFVLLTTGVGFAQETPAIQWAPVPADPNELVTGGAKALTNPQERSAALQLLDRAPELHLVWSTCSGLRPQGELHLERTVAI
jgi:hypothetical protein